MGCCCWEVCWLQHCWKAGHLPGAIWRNLFLGGAICLALRLRRSAALRSTKTHEGAELRRKDYCILTLRRRRLCRRFGGLQALQAPFFFRCCGGVASAAPEKGDSGEAGCPLGASPNPSTA